jgi:diguanylate cyclase (GGDEF)-like protein
MCGKAGMPEGSQLCVDPCEELIHELVTSAATPLRKLLDGWNRRSAPYRLVKNAAGLIDGILDLRRIDRMLRCDDPVERARWEAETAGAVADSVFAEPVGSPRVAYGQAPEAIVEGVPIHDSTGCVAIVAGGETYVSWSRVAAAMQQNQFDPVTQLPTRTAFKRRLREEVNRSARAGRPLAVVIIDIDYFKRINDEFGHAAGDTALLMTADSLRAGFRSYDFVARYAGDEFVVLCNDCKPSHIGLPIVRLQRALAARLSAATNPGLRITLSVGVATLAEIDPDCLPELIVEQADACLYEAKRAGRATVFAVELDRFAQPLGTAYEMARDN